MKIGLISDTHGRLPAEVFEFFKDVDLILHAGDVGKAEVLTDLRTIAPVKAVYGNVDRFPLVSQLTRMEFVKVEKLWICLTHIVSSEKDFCFQLFKINKKVDVVVYGHTHRADKTDFDGTLFVNPGSAAQPRYTKKRSVALMVVSGSSVNVEFKFF